MCNSNVIPGISAIELEGPGAGSMRLGKRHYEPPTVLPRSLRVPALRPGMATPEGPSWILSSSEGIQGTNTF